MHTPGTTEAPTEARPLDVRNQYARDRDRISHTSAFRRLAGVTQVVSSAEDPHIFHNRQSHTIETAQIARRLAEQLLSRQGDLARRLGCHPEVADAAALAHDLGHPPFGHLGEETLDEVLTRDFQVLEGFEGNAQTFRIVTKLAVVKKRYPGLDLTRATLDAILKYPRPPEIVGGKKSQKFGAYGSEAAELNWARELHDRDDREKSLEAEIMDWADDIAYAVHDVEDFYRAGLIPLDRILRDHDEELERFFVSVFERWKREEVRSDFEEDELRFYFTRLVKVLRAQPDKLERYEGTLEQRAALRSLKSLLIERFANAIKVREPDDESGRCVEIRHEAMLEVTMLKQLTWQYVIRNPALATQQHGQRRIIRELMHVFRDSAKSRDRSLLPRYAIASLDQQLESAADEGERQMILARVVTDLVGGLTEKQALSMYTRLTGHSPGSVLDML
jgi:dGTPase